MVVLVALGVLSAAASLYITRRTPAFFPDSSIYLGTADNIRTGHGTTTPFNLIFNPYPPFEAFRLHHEVPLTIFPPMFSVLIAAVNLLGVGLIDAARYLEAASFAGSTILSGVIVARISGRRGVGVVAAVTFAASSSVLFTHASLMSDPVLLVLLLAGFMALDRVVLAPTPERLALLALFAALAALTRYAGLSLAFTAAIILVARLPRPRAVRIRWALVVLAAGVLPLLLWVTAGAGSSEATAARRLGFHPPGYVDLNTVFDAISSWFVGLTPGAVLRWIAVVVAVAVLVALVLLRARLAHRHEERTSLVMILSVFAACFVVTLAAARTFTDALFPMDVRNLLPLYAAFLLVLFGLAGKVLDALGGRVVAVVCAVALALLIAWPDRVALFPGLFRTPIDVLDQGVFEYPRSPLARAAKKLPKDALIVTNVADKLYLQEGIRSITVPARYFVIEGRKNPRFEAEIDELEKLLKRECGYLVMNISVPTALPNTDELRSRIPLVDVTRIFEGAILRPEKLSPRCGAA